MKLCEVLSKEKRGNVTETSHQVVATLQNMIVAMNNSSTIQPSQFYNDWCRGNNSIINQLSRTLLVAYPVVRVIGNKTKELFLSSLLSFKLTDYIRKLYDPEFDFKTNKLLKYDCQKYYHISVISVAMLINKYNPNSLYHEHIIFTCIKVLLTYFPLYDGDRYLVNLGDMGNVCKLILQTDINALNNYAKSLGFRYSKKEQFAIRQTLSKEEILKLIDPSDSQTEIRNKIMKWCPCGERKARYLMQKYNLTKAKYTRKDYIKKL